jgi:hypothetical protein
VDWSVARGEVRLDRVRERWRSVERRCSPTG